jgi:2-keto-4-pentenoate hydratase/2-oxohepta-3-ene-1,7-dioic acid hydratase in catechol pathway
MPREQVSISVGMSKIRSVVRASWRSSPLTQQRTTDLIFDIPTLIETCSRGITLYPGDVIATGTPAGVGMGLQPPRWLAPGDEVRIEIDGLGVLANRFVEDSA